MIRRRARADAIPCWPLAAAVYAAAAAWMGRHVLVATSTTIASDPGDPLLNAAILAWNATQLPWTDSWFQFPIFHPTRDTLTFSEHLLGLSVVASPFFWLTGSAAAAYNITLLLSYPLCGLAMYALVWRLTRSSPAAFVAGLAFAFAPYRTSQLPHIQMLAVFWAPLALLGLHGFLERTGARAAAGVPAGPPSAGLVPQPHPTGPASPGSALWRHSDQSRGAGSAEGGPAGRWRSLVLFAVCWALQGAANGYMLVYFSLFAGGWVLWFLAARRRWRETACVAGAAAVAALPLLPILYRYVVAHRDLGLTRNLGEMSAFSADLAAPLCAAPALSLWGWLRVACAPEGELFPGIALVALCVAGALLYIRRSRAHPARASRSAMPAADMHRGDAAREHSEHSRARTVLMAITRALALVFFGIALSLWFIGPWRIELGWLRASASSADKPLSTALALLLVAFLLSPTLHSAIRRGSTLTFYAGGAFICWVLSWGPFPRLFGVSVLYQAPYAWLLQLPGVDALRAPARFWMLTVLCLAVVAGLVIAELLRGRSRRASVGVAAAAGCMLLLDGWATIPAAPLPRPPAEAPVLRGTPVLVAPAGDLHRDVATVYHAVAGGWIAINGYSGYEPGYYEALRTLSQAGSDAQFEPFLRRGAIQVVDARGITRLEPRAGPRVPSAPPGRRLAVAAADASCSSGETRYAVDGNIDSLWLCDLQHAEQHIAVDLGGDHDVAAVVHVLGSAGAAFPQQLVIETSRDATTWEAAWDGFPAALVLAAAMQEPRQTRVVITFAARPARYVRLRHVGRRETAYWAIAELEVWSEK